jgi:hypothetical protein
MDIEADPIESDDTLEVEPEDVTAEPVADSGPIRQLRSKLETTQAELAVAKERERLRSYADIGLNPEEGMGRAISTTYQGDGSDLAEYAETEFGYRFAGVENPLVAEINNAYSRLDQAAVGAGSAPMTAPADSLADAEARRDNQTTMAIKGQQVASWFR